MGPLPPRGFMHYARGPAVGGELHLARHVSEPAGPDSNKSGLARRSLEPAAAWLKMSQVSLGGSRARTGLIQSESGLGRRVSEPAAA